MERMQINLISVLERNGVVVARARAEAEQARIWVEVRIDLPINRPPAELWQVARDEVLRYLDPR